MRIKSLLTLSIVSIVTSTILHANDSNELESVTVTANKVEENIQDIPQSITVIDGDILKEKNIDSIPKIIDEIPNMNAIESKGFGTVVNFRGLNASMFTNNNPVVVYIDGVPITDKYSYKISLENAKRVEVLRGPQGSLYGKDAIGAVINIVTNDTPEELMGYIGAEYGSNNFMKTSFNIASPFMNNKLYMGINGEFKKDDGWITNAYNGDDEAEKSENKNLNVYFKYLPTDRLSMKLNLSKSENEDYYIAGSSFDSSLDISDISRDDAENVSFDIPTYETRDTDTQSFALKYALDIFDLDWVSTHRSVDLDGVYDSDYTSGTDDDGLTQWNYSETETFTHEFRLSNNENDIRWVAGLYLDNENREQGPYGYESYYYGSTYYANADSTTDTNTQAIFAQAMIPLDKTIELTLGGRYQKIKKEFDVDVLTTWGGTTMSDFTIDTDKTWNVFLPKMALSYKANDSFTPFVSISKGYMPGGFNYFPSSSSVEDSLFDPQESINYEIGLKGVYKNFLYSAAIFYMDITDIHVYKSDGNNWYTENADRAHSMGIEIEGQYFINNNFDISGSIGIIKAEYDDYDAGSKNFDGEDIENIPSHTASLTLTYKGDTGFYGLVDIKDQGSISFYDNTNQVFLKDDGHTISNIKLGREFSNWDLYGYIDNITDEEYINTYMSKTGLTVATFNEPRFIGVGAKYKF